MFAWRLPFVFSCVEVIPKAALQAKTKDFFRRQGGRSSHSQSYGDCRPTPLGGKKIPLQPK
jgi:hypothetical protein